MAMIEALLFDKDGTLFDFEASWGPWFIELISDISQDSSQAAALAKILEFDLESGSFGPESDLIHGTNEDFVNAALKILPHWERDALLQHGIAQSSHVAQVPVTPLAPLLDGFIGHGLTLGVATNDNEVPARAQLLTAGIIDRFAHIFGSDSGFGAKPETGMQRAFCEKTGIEAKRVAMVGDSKHDLVSGRHAGMQAIGVLTGVATRAHLMPFADVVLNDISEIPAYLAAQ